MLQPNTKRNIQRVLPFGLIWMVSGWVFLVVELAAAGSFSQLPATAIQVDAQIFIVSSLAILGVGVLIGLIELKYLHDAFSNKNFILRFLFKLSNIL